MAKYGNSVTSPDKLLKITKINNKAIEFEFDTGRVDLLNGIYWNTTKHRTSDDGLIRIIEAASGESYLGFEVTSLKPITLNNGSADTVCVNVLEVNSWLITNLT